jgi:hypothetical protein
VTVAIEPQWYKKIWSLDVQDLSWVEQTAGQVDFLLVSYIRLYTLQELRVILQAHGLKVRQTYGDYDLAAPASDDRFALLAYSEKST